MTDPDQGTADEADDAPDAQVGSTVNLIAIIHTVLTGLLASHPLAEAVDARFAALLASVRPAKPIALPEPEAAADGDGDGPEDGK
jgi:hypothetical protein